MSYKVYTFRGFARAESFQDASNLAVQLIRDIRRDKFGSVYWWARIEETESQMFELVSYRYGYGFMWSGLKSY